MALTHVRNSASWLPQIIRESFPEKIPVSGEDSRWRLRNGERRLPAKQLQDFGTPFCYHRELPYPYLNSEKAWRLFASEFENILNLYVHLWQTAEVLDTGVTWLKLIHHAASNLFGRILLTAQISYTQASLWCSCISENDTSKSSGTFWKCGALTIPAGF